MTGRGRPAIGPQIAVAMDPLMLAWIDTAAAADGISRSEWIRRACAAALHWTALPQGHRDL
jgi:hypothetical protein